MNSNKDKLGNRMKTYESQFDVRINRGECVIVRLDGKGFSKFTRGMKKPHDDNMMEAMRSVTSQLIEVSNAILGYTQSDEITLCFQSDQENPESQIYFDGRVQKLTSVLASYASIFFYREIVKRFPDLADKIPVFDARVFTVPNETEMRNAVLWRVFDARRNSILGCAQVRYSHKEMQGVCCKDLIKNMQTDHHFDWNYLEDRYKYGYMLYKQKETMGRLVRSGIVSMNIENFIENK